MILLAFFPEMPCHANQVSQKSCSHLSNDVTAMKLDVFFGAGSSWTNKGLYGGSFPTPALFRSFASSRTSSATLAMPYVVRMRACGLSPVDRRRSDPLRTRAGISTGSFPITARSFRLSRAAAHAPDLDYVRRPAKPDAAATNPSTDLIRY